MQKIGQGSLSARVYQALREALIAGDYEPDQRLKMQDLAEQLGTSITPVREACLRLVSEHSLELRSGRFVSVPELTRDRYMQVRLIRINLERLATTYAAKNATLADVKKLHDLHEKFVAAEIKGDLPKARRFNQQFHFYLYSLSGMDLLTSQIEAMWASMGPILNVYYRQLNHGYEGAEEHLEIIQGLQNKDGSVASDALERDIVRGGLSLLHYFDAKSSGLQTA